MIVAGTDTADTMENPDRIQAAANEHEQPMVRIQDASVRLDNRLVWTDMSLDVYPGEFIAVLGSNGAGKSTLLKALLGLVPIAHGHISIQGLPPRRARGQIGYVPQRRHFGPDVRVRGRDVVRLGLDGARWGFSLPFLNAVLRNQSKPTAAQRVQRAIEQVGATHLADRPIGGLSGGEQQRMLVAQALVTRPALLLLDEPLDSLDVANQREVSRIIREVSREVGAAVLLVAHDVNPLLPYVDRICYLAGGHAAIGSPREVITSETLSRLYGVEVEVLRTRDGQLVVVGQPEGVPCVDHDHSMAHSR